jgi:hypothetical protein
VEDKQREGVLMAALVHPEHGVTDLDEQTHGPHLRIPGLGLHHPASGVLLHVNDARPSA